MYNYNPAQSRVDSLMQQRQMIDQQIQNLSQYANIPPININNQINPQTNGFDFNGKWVNNEQEARNFTNANLPTILFDNNESIFYMKSMDGSFKKFKFEEIKEETKVDPLEERINGIEKKMDEFFSKMNNTNNNNNRKQVNK